MCVSVAQLCPILYNPMNCSPPGSSVHRILQAKILQVAISFSNITHAEEYTCVCVCVSDLTNNDKITHTSNTELQREH